MTKLTNEQLEELRPILMRQAQSLIRLMQHCDDHPQIREIMLAELESLGSDKPSRAGFLEHAFKRHDPKDAQISVHIEHLRKDEKDEGRSDYQTSIMVALPDTPNSHHSIIQAVVHTLLKICPTCTIAALLEEL